MTEAQANLPSDKPARKSKKFLGALGYTLSVYGFITLCAFSHVPLDGSTLMLLASGLPLVWGVQVGGQAIQDREIAKAGGAKVP